MKNITENFNNMGTQHKIQDPSNPNTSYLIEDILKLIREERVVKWQGIYSWTTGITLSKLFLDDPDLKKILKNNSLKVEMLFGIDTVTTDFALNKMVELSEFYENFRPKIFDNDVVDLFHPKFSLFHLKNGDIIIVLGSGNFTLNGLQGNIEAYSITRQNQYSPFNNDLNNFFDFHSNEIKDISNQLIEKCKSNRASLEFEKEDQHIKTVSKNFIADNSQHETNQAEVLIAQIPKAGGRWKQVHYNKDVVKKFFQVSNDSHQRVFLKEFKPDGSEGDFEIRPVVYSSSNKNFKIEINPSTDYSYPNSYPPIIVLRKVGTRIFLYTLLFPENPHFESVRKFLESKKSIGKGVRRAIINGDDVLKIWPDCPLFKLNY